MGLAALTSSCSASSTSTSTSTSTKIVPPLAIHVKGNHLVDATGADVTLHGVDISGTARGCVSAPAGTDPLSAITASDFGDYSKAPLTDQRLYDTLAAQHVDVIRIPLNEDCLLGINGVDPAWSGATYLGVITTIVTEAARAGIDTIVDLHLNAPGSEPALDQQQLADEDHAVTFWSALANDLKYFPSVIFDLYNEPHLTTAPTTSAEAAAWRCWRDGCRLDSWDPGMITSLVAPAAQRDRTISVTLSPRAPTTGDQLSQALGSITSISIGGLDEQIASSRRAAGAEVLTLAEPLRCTSAAACAASAEVRLMGARYPGGWAAAGMQQLVSSVRATGADQPILLGGLGWASSDSLWQRYAPRDPEAATPLGSQLIAAAHLYPVNQRCDVTPQSCSPSIAAMTKLWSDEVPASLEAHVPVMLSETGDNAERPLTTSSSADGSRAYLPALLAHAKQQGWSTLAWSYNDWPAPGVRQFELLAPAGIGSLRLAAPVGATELTLAGSSAWGFAPSSVNRSPALCLGTDCSQVRSATALAPGLERVELMTPLVTAHPAGALVDDGGAGYLRAILDSGEGSSYFAFLSSQP